MMNTMDQKTYTKTEEHKARQIIRKLSADGHLPRATVCHIKADTEGIPVLRITIQKIIIDGIDIHPVTRQYLLRIAETIIRFAATKLAGVEIGSKHSRGEELHTLEADNPNVTVDSSPVITAPLMAEFESFQRRPGAAEVGKSVRAYTEPMVLGIHNFDPWASSLRFENFNTLAKNLDNLVRSALQ